MNPKTLTDLLTPIVGLGTVMVGLGSAIVAITKYFDYKSERDKIRAIGEAFETVIAALRSDNSVERMSGAIRLRRFYDPKREMGTGRDAPYAKVAIDVAVAVLRGQPTSDFQKLLADGVGLAASLRRVDLQRTNLQFAYLGSRRMGDEREEIVSDLTYADFYGADLSRASLRGANASHAQFYQARLHKTIFKEANLTGANFFDADINGAVFDGATLDGANFSSARDLPAGIREKLDRQGIYRDPAPFHSPPKLDQYTAPVVFVSKPGCLTSSQKQSLDTVYLKLRSNGLVPRTLERQDYPKYGAVAEVRRLLRGCDGAIIFGFPELKVLNGIWRAGTTEEADLSDYALPTPWVQIEAGMAAMAGLPIFVVHEGGLKAGVFGVGEDDTAIYYVCLNEDWDGMKSTNAFSNWLADVREFKSSGGSSSSSAL